MSCDCKSKNFADFESAAYNPLKNQILYGINKNMKAFGVSDGTCNQINPIMYSDAYKCGLGVAGGNPCSNNDNYINYINNIDNIDNINNIETFKNTKKNTNNGYNFTNLINTIIIILIIYLIYLIYYNN